MGAMALLGTIMLFMTVVAAQGIRLIRAANALNASSIAAESAASLMVEHLVSASEAKLGLLTPADIDSLNGELSAFPLPEGVTLDLSRSRYVLTDVRAGERIPAAEPLVSIVTDQPRTRIGTYPSPAGLYSAQTLEVAVVATVTTDRGGRRAALARLGVSKIPPYQHAVYAAGDAELCVRGAAALVSGSVQADGMLTTRCQGSLYLGGSLAARDELNVEGPGTARIMWAGAQKDLRSLDAADFADVQSSLREWDGRIRLAAPLGGEVGAAVVQDSASAGHGECLDMSGECNGGGVFLPSVEVWRASSGQGSEYQMWCGPAYESTSCSAVGDAVSYVPFPFESPSTAGEARPNPGQPSALWKGLFPDYRREARCSAEVGGLAYKTFRCPTNPYGFVIDVASLPAIEGGVLSVRRSTKTSSLNNPSGLQEVVLIQNAAQLAGALTIASDLPVYIEGDFNTALPHPALIQAPLITVLPAETTEQLRSAAVWDSAGAPASVIIQARSSVEINAVLRGPYTPSSLAGAYFGEILERLPSVLGDWSGVNLTVNGAVEGWPAAEGSIGDLAGSVLPFDAAPTEMQSQEPMSRIVRFNERLLDPAWQPRGSWYWRNLPVSGGVAGRDRARQAHAIGGFAVVRMLQAPTRLPVAPALSATTSPVLAPPLF